MKTSREKIVEISLAIVEEEGVEQLTIRRIAAEIDRTQPAVYQHFANKEAIITALVIEGFSALEERMAKASTKDGTLTAILRAYVKFALDRPRLYKVMFVDQPAIVFASPAETPIEAQRVFNLLAQALKTAAGTPTNNDTETEIVWAALHGLALLQITNRLRPTLALQKARLDELIALVARRSAS